MDRPRLLTASLARVTAWIAGFLVVAGLPASLWFQQQNPPRALPWSVIAVSWAIGAVVLVALIGSTRSAVTATVVGLLRHGATRLAVPLLAGAVLRLLVAIVLKSTPASDGATYLGLAHRLVEQHEYGSPDTRAFWPPGLPFFLAPLVDAFGTGRFTLVLYGLSTFVIAAFGVFLLGRAIGLGRYATLPVWLLACWPSLVLCAGLPEKELLLVALMPWIVLCATRLDGESAVPAVAGGLLLGMAILCQPSLQLLVVLPFAAIAWARGSRLRMATRCAAVVAAALVVVGPWILRNHDVLDGTLAVATNGGGVLYRANNELATGAYTARGQVDLDALDEVESDRRGKRLAVAWIRHDPARFLQLTAGRTLLFAGDDSYGAFAALRRGQPERFGNGVGGSTYAGIKLFTMVPWLVLWAIAVVAVTRRRLAEELPRLIGVLAFVPYLYLTGIHAIFESGGKYHLPASSCLFVGVIWLLHGALVKEDVA